MDFIISISVNFQPAVSTFNRKFSDQKPPAPSTSTLLKVDWLLQKIVCSPLTKSIVSLFPIPSDSTDSQIECTRFPRHLQRRCSIRRSGLFEKLIRKVTIDVAYCKSPHVLSIFVTI